MSKTLTFHVAIAGVIIIATLLMPAILPTQLQTISPFIGVAMFYYFLRRHLRTISILLAIILGGLIDIMQHMPMGIAISGMLIFYLMAKPDHEESRLPRVFPLHMAYFMLHSAFLSLWIYGLNSLVNWTIYPMVAPMMQWVATIAIYPVIYQFCRHYSRFVLKIEGAQ